MAQRPQVNNEYQQVSDDYKLHMQTFGNTVRAVRSEAASRTADCAMHCGGTCSGPRSERLRCRPCHAGGHPTRRGGRGGDHVRRTVWSSRSMRCGCTHLRALVSTRPMRGAVWLGRAPRFAGGLGLLGSGGSAARRACSRRRRARLTRGRRTPRAGGRAASSRYLRRWEEGGGEEGEREAGRWEGCREQ